MTEIEKTIAFLKDQLQEARKVKEEREGAAAEEDMIEQRLERIEKLLIEIKKAIVG